ncbi:LlaJI family restriction endonuclease [Enterovibrio norvegicus]|uniref:LlaJI family restriction endonuclease n=1 Tax=Enterovibrio norvegicus TaxID=188144 RepID=UPI00352D7D19
MHNLQYFTDRAFISGLPVGLPEAMRKQGLIAPEQSKVHFCGFFSWKGGTAVFLPVNSDVNVKPELSAHWLLQTLNRYYADKMTGLKDTGGESLIGGSLLSLSVELFEDYRSNGLYVRRNRLRTVNQGKVNWSRTVSRHTPYPSASAPVYLDLESSRTRYVSNCETARIHAAVIQDIRLKFGVLLYGDEQESDDRLDTMPPPWGDSEAWLAYLNRELALSYSERDITLIKSLSRYIDNSQGSDEDSLIIGTRHFHGVWESMLDYSLEGVAQYNRKLAVPYYLMNGLYHEVADKGQRTDTVIRSENHFAVVDAKYYGASSPGRAPGWPDIVKQLYYQKAVQDAESGSAVVTTHFVFPGSEAKLISAHVSSRGQHKSEVLDNSAGYPVIHCHYCEPVELMRAYVSYRRLPALRTQILNSGENARLSV